ncbi:MAG: thioredoxin family protein [Bacteroidales bacterium]|nr:thioredoxin family protein [Bacteroidales bacterium]
MSIVSKAFILNAVFLFAAPCAFSQESNHPPLPDEPAASVTLTIHLRNVYESRISLLPLTGRKALPPLIEKEGVKNGETAILTIPGENLPGDFVIRFDYKEEAVSTPYPSEKTVIIYRQNMELWADPLYCNNPDSTYFSEGEKENSVHASFVKENKEQKEMLALLQSLLLYYDDVQSDLYRESIKEYEKRRLAHNRWIRGQISEHDSLFVSARFGFELVPPVSWEGSETERKQSLMDHYFDEIDLTDPLLAKTPDFTRWMDSYVNLYGEFASTVEKRDSLFTLAGKKAIEKAGKGHPLVYGWMVDYFFTGFESFDIQTGIAMLKPYLDDPGCLTSKRQAILKRLEGMETLIAGTVAPDFTFMDETGSETGFHACPTGKPYKLLLFWSADCSHCAELVDALYPWFLKEKNREKLEVFAVSLDENETERAEWKKKTETMPGWKHIPTEGGVNSALADKYFILATPVMILTDAATHCIIAQPGTVEQLEKAMK